MSIFLDLPKVISVSIFSKWCDIEALAKFDSANCQRTCRLHILNLFQMPLFVIFVDISGDYEGIYEWIALRKMKTDILRVKGPFADNFSFLTNNLDLSKVTHIVEEVKSLKVKPFQLSTLINSCRVLISLDLDGDFINLNQVVPKIDINILSQLTRLEIGQDNISTGTINKISKHCTKLERLFLAGKNAVNENVLVNLVLNNTRLVSIFLWFRRTPVSHDSFKLIVSNCVLVERLTLICGFYDSWISALQNALENNEYLMLIELYYNDTVSTRSMITIDLEHQLARLSNLYDMIRITEVIDLFARFSMNISDVESWGVDFQNDQLCATMINSLHSIQNFLIFNCAGYTVSSLESLLRKHSDTLTFLFLKYCPQISNEQLVSLLKTPNNITNLVLGGDTDLNNKTITQIMNSNHQLEYVYIDSDSADLHIGALKSYFKRYKPHVNFHVEVNSDNAV